MKLVVGSAQFGMSYGINNRVGMVPTNELYKIRDLAYKNSINIIDTAANYGVAEERMGEIFGSHFNYISKIHISSQENLQNTKFYLNLINNSIRKLRVNILSGLLIHNPESILSNKKIIEFLLELKKDGIFQKIGISIYSPDNLEKYYDIYPFDIIQAPLNIFDRRITNDKYMTMIKENNSELHVRSIFLQGLLLNRLSLEPKFSRWKNLFINWNKWLDKNKINPLDACLRHALSYKENINKIVVGVDSSQQLSDILAAYKSGPLDVPIFENDIDVKLISPNMWHKL